MKNHLLISVAVRDIEVAGGMGALPRCNQAVHMGS